MLTPMGKSTPRRRDPMVITPTALQKARTQAVTPSRLQRAMDLMAEIRQPVYPPGVEPPSSSKQRKANDSAFAASLSYLATMCQGQGFLGFQFLAELAQVSEYRQMSTRLAQEMTRKWIRLRSRSSEDLSDDIKAVTIEMERLQVQAHFRQMAELDGLFGRGQLYIDVGDKADSELGKELSLTPQKIPKNSLRGFKVVEPAYSYGYLYNAADPLKPGFFEPQTWFIYNREVHHSRLLTFISRPLPAILRPAYAFAGMSLSQLALPTIENFLKMRQSVSNLLLNYSLRGLKTNLQTLLEGGSDVENITRRIDLYIDKSSNEGLMLLDKDSEEFFQHTTPLTNVDKLLDQARDAMCAIANIPRMVLFGLSPEGMNASSDGEIKVFDQFIAGMQETLFRAHLERVLAVIQLSVLGRINPDITFDFVPIRSLDEKELSEVRYRNAMATNIYLNGAVVSSQEARKNLAVDPTSGWDNLDVNQVVVPAFQTKPINPTGAAPNDLGESA